jgi:hypothetical protein
MPGDADWRVSGLGHDTSCCRRSRVSLFGTGNLNQDWRQNAEAMRVDTSRSVRIAAELITDFRQGQHRLFALPACYDLRQDLRRTGLCLSADIILRLYRAGVGTRLSLLGQRCSGISSAASGLRPGLSGGGGEADITGPHAELFSTRINVAGNRRNGIDQAGGRILSRRASGLDGHTETWTRDAYAVYLDGDYLGDIPADPDAVAGETNYLSLGALADGTYTVTIRPRGRFWRETGAGKTLTLTVAGGAVSASTLPAVTGVGITYEGGLTAIGWTLPEAYGAADVVRFGLWYAAAGAAPDTTATPDDTVPALDGAGARYQAFRAQPAGATESVSLCCLDTAGTRGPAVTVNLPALAAAPLSPANQRAEENA